MRPRSLFLALFFSTMLLVTSFGQWATAQTAAESLGRPQPMSQEQLTQQGLARYHDGDYANAIALWQQAMLSPKNSADGAATLHRYLARAHQAQGQIEASIQEFDWLLAYYRRQYHHAVKAIPGDARGDAGVDARGDASDPFPSGQLLGQMLTEQAQNYSRLGHHPRAASLLCRDMEPLEVEALLEKSESLEEEPLGCDPESAVGLALVNRDGAGLAAALGSLGQTQRLQGEYDLAIATLNRGLKQLTDSGAEDSSRSVSLSVSFNDRNDSLEAHRRAMLDSLGNLYAAQAARSLRLAEFAQTKRKTDKVQGFLEAAKQSNQLALDKFAAAQAVPVPPSPGNLSAAVLSRLNAMAVARRDRNDVAPPDWADVRRQVRALPPSRAKVYGLLKLASLSQPLASSPLASSPRIPNAPATTAPVTNAPVTNAPVTNNSLLSAPSFLSPELAAAMDAADLNFSAFRDEAPTYCAPLGRETWTLLQEARRIARRIQDYGTESFVLGRLGHLQECEGNSMQALEWTRQARLLAPRDSRYRWDWQEGRILMAQGNWGEAKLAYEQTLRTLKGMRGELALAVQDFQLDFRETIEPIYRELTALRLQALSASVGVGPTSGPTSGPVSGPASGSASTDNELLETTLQGMDELHLFELQNYLGQGCDLPESTALMAIDPTTAFVSTFVLADRVAVVLTLPTTETTKNPQGETRFKLQSQLKWFEIEQAQLTQDINQFRLDLGDRSDLTQGYLTQATALYDGLIRPLGKALEAASVNTLVFMHDGILRSVPMAALYDGERGQFLVEDYAIAYTPSLSLVEPRPLPPGDLNVLAFGLTQPARVEVAQTKVYFPALENVAQELTSLGQSVPQSEALLDEQFTLKQLSQSLAAPTSPIQMLHLATHARFGFDGRQTFLVTGRDEMASPALREDPAWDSLPPSAKVSRRQRVRESVEPSGEGQTLNNGKLTLLQLQKLASDSAPLELLTLSACDTATGSERDVLGIAGIAFQSGVWSTLASLWQVDDAATAEMMAQFYENLQGNQSAQGGQTGPGEPGRPGRAIALQAMQKQWLREVPNQALRHPGYWSSFVLVGNWL